MKATIRRFASPDVDLNSFVPDDSRRVKFLLEVFVGPSDAPGEERFAFEVVSLAELDAVLDEQGVVAGIHKLIVKEFDWVAIRQMVERIVSRASGDTWEQLASSIGRFGQWEFEP
jgi:hypothetical protein